MPPRVKICGTTTETDVDVAVEAGADAVGVLTDVPVESPREVGADRAAELLASLPPFVTGVLVTMPETPARVLELAERTDPDAVQLHGDLPRGDLAYLRSKLDATLIVAVDADRPESVPEAADLADAVLVDSVDDDGGGGTGRTHDWNRTREAIRGVDTPAILAGGLTPDNVAEAVRTVDPFGVDVASGVEASDPESADGRKDPDAVADFVENARHRREEVRP